ncbi:MAG TPA: prepilin-type N-terminal cleavage/methylation domain-containing protein [Candidatus Binatia bacterium]|jgi:prepilin-type N-terminal cleavage/methylation domain-containing protein
MSLAGMLSYPRRPRLCQSHGRDGAPAAGFTLVEVVIALTIFALMSAILYGAFSLSHRAVEKSQGNATRNQKQRSVADLVGSYVRSAFPYRQSAQETAAFFQGEADSLTFVSAYSQGMGGRGMAKIQIATGEGGDGRAVLRLEETTPVRIDAEEGTAAGQVYSVILEDAVKQFRLAYLDPQADAETWEERWDGRERRTLPRAVRVSYLDDHDRPVRWVFPVMMTVLAP